VGTRVVAVSAALLAGALAVSPASAQPLTLGVPSSPRPTPVLPPNQGVQQLPAPEAHMFVTPLSRPTRTGRAGIAIWGAPGTATSQRGPGDPDSVGWVGAGMAAEWGGGPRRTTPN
jgi:hypothetical protein